MYANMSNIDIDAELQRYRVISWIFIILLNSHEGRHFGGKTFLNRFYFKIANQFPVLLPIFTIS